MKCKISFNFEKCMLKGLMPFIVDLLCRHNYEIKVLSSNIIFDEIEKLCEYIYYFQKMDSPNEIKLFCFRKNNLEIKDLEVLWEKMNPFKSLWININDTFIFQSKK